MVMGRLLAPAAAGLMLALVGLQSRPSGLLPLVESGPGASLAVAAFSNQFYAAYLPATHHSQQNASHPARLEWTNEGSFRSSVASFSRMATNHLR
jgi:hypothetical protein